eukprot:c26166_g1_i1.p1 GENE.c26166_g1_i1~~c26166_g1_i1.p1  ORF type:complete len:125 (+),score=32.70 c26166_g1_i1:173-547(+)
MWWIRAAGLLGCSGVGLAAYGSHGMNGAEEQFKKSFESANRMHLFHALALLAAGHSAFPNATAGLLTCGVLIFSGSCYAVALTQDRQFAKYAPIGGFMLMAGWLGFLIPRAVVSAVAAASAKRL